MNYQDDTTPKTSLYPGLDFAIGCGCLSILVVGVLIVGLAYLVQWWTK